MFFDTFKPVKNHLDSNAPYDECMFETYGDEVAFVKAQPKDRVFTLLTGDDGSKLYIVPGWHFVNRMGYFVTEVPWTKADELKCFFAG